MTVISICVFGNLEVTSLLKITRNNKMFALPFWSPLYLLPCIRHFYLEVFEAPLPLIIILEILKGQPDKK